MTQLRQNPPKEKVYFSATSVSLMLMHSRRQHRGKNEGVVRNDRLPLSFCATAPKSLETLLPQSFGSNRNCFKEIIV